MFSLCRCGEMVDAADSKSAPSNRVLVRSRSPAIKKGSRLASLFYYGIVATSHLVKILPLLPRIWSF